MWEMEIICGRDCRRRVTVITFFPERRRDSLTTWPAVVIHSLWQYLCVWLDILFPPSGELEMNLEIE